MNAKSQIILLTLIILVIFTGTPVQAQTRRSTADWQPNGHLIAYVSDGILVLFDTISEQRLNILTSVPDNLFVAVWSTDGTRLAVSDVTGAVYIWSITTDNHSRGELIGVLRDFDNAVVSLAWSATGQWLAGSGWDGTYNVQVWDMDTFQPVFRATTGNTYKVSWSPNHDLLAITTIGGAYSINFDQLTALLPVDFATFSEFANIATEYIPASNPLVHQSRYAAVPITWSPDGTRIVTGDFEGTLRVFNVSSGAEIATLSNAEIVTALDWSPDGEYLAGSVRSGEVFVWETNTYRVVGVFPTDANVSMLSFSPFGGRLAFKHVSPTDLQATIANEAIQIVVPAPSLERLQTIAEACNAPTATEQSLTTNIQADHLTEFIAQVEALPDDAIPSACRADLLAVAGALQTDE